MGRLKHRAKKKRLVRQSKIHDPPLWAHIKKFGLKRIRTRRIIVAKIKHWRRDSKVKK